jgi:hypothetical protein
MKEELEMIGKATSQLNECVVRLNRKYLGLTMLLIDKGIITWEELEPYDGKAEAFIKQHLNTPEVKEELKQRDPFIGERFGVRKLHG